MLGVSDADADGARAELWPKLFNAARLLPSLFSFLRRFFRGTAGAGGAPAAAAAAAAGSMAPPPPADGLRNRQSVGMLAEHARRRRRRGRPRATRASEVKRPIDPYECHVLCALQGAPTEAAAFGGLVVVDAESLHRPEEVEPARPLRVALARAFGRSWLEAAMWLSSWDDAWLLLAVEGKIEHDYVKDAFGANEAKAALHTRRRALLAAAPVALVPNAARKAR